MSLTTLNLATSETKIPEPTAKIASFQVVPAVNAIKVENFDMGEIKKPEPKPIPKPEPKPAPAPTPPPAPPVTVDPGSAQAIAQDQVLARGWGDGEFTCLVNLWNRESSWRADALNASSGAYGIPQSLPGEKMASAGADWKTNPATQIKWGLDYISARYGSPCGAWSHSEATNWY